MQLKKITMGLLCAATMCTTFSAGRRAPAQPQLSSYYGEMLKRATDLVSTLEQIVAAGQTIQPAQQVQIDQATQLLESAAPSVPKQVNEVLIRLLNLQMRSSTQTQQVMQKNHAQLLADIQGRIATLEQQQQTANQQHKNEIDQALQQQQVLRKQQMDDQTGAAAQRKQLEDTIAKLRLQLSQAPASGMSEQTFNQQLQKALQELAAAQTVRDQAENQAIALERKTQAERDGLQSQLQTERERSNKEHAEAVASAQKIEKKQTQNIEIQSQLIEKSNKQLAQAQADIQKANKQLKDCEEQLQKIKASCALLLDGNWIIEIAGASLIQILDVVNNLSEKLARLQGGNNITLNTTASIQLQGIIKNLQQITQNLPTDWGVKFEEFMKNIQNLDEYFK